VRPLPIAGRPASFVNAIGRGFSIEVDASRTVVSVGDPIELTLRLRGDGPLAGLSLPPLDGPEGLPAQWFGVPGGGVAGRVDAGANVKLFSVTIRVKSDEAREIPPIAFSWFDPEAREYHTTRSQPIALSVESAELVGAGEVVAAEPAASGVIPRSGPSRFNFRAVVINSAIKSGWSPFPACCIRSAIPRSRPACPILYPVILVRVMACIRLVARRSV